MNWLAHLWLADKSHTSAAGQLLGDEIKGRIDPATSPLGQTVARGIVIHRRIDRLADDHRLHRALRRLFTGSHRRYAGIVVDIGLDHALARVWPTLNDEPLEAFTARLCTQLVREWPCRAVGRSAPESAGFSRLLTGYTRASGVARALRHVEQRLRRPVDLVPLTDTVVAHRGRFEQAIGPILDDLLEAIEDQTPPTDMSERR
ncbi:MAG: hypothetical protein CMP08_01235 [Xanthomonadales bacterium]|nr:hypothetical protein [Xanthomonadales bacterium]